jgi:hypothetical protein
MCLETLVIAMEVMMSILSGPFDDNKGAQCNWGITQHLQ